MSLRDIFNQSDVLKLPIWGNAGDIPRGSVLKKGTTAGSNNGALMQSTGDGAADEVGFLQQMLDYSVDGETLIAGTSFVTKPVKLINPVKIHLIEYDLTSLITCTQAVTTTAMTVTSLEDDIDAGFVYVAAGTGIGQINYLTAASGGAVTLKAAFGTSLDTTSQFVKVLPRFHQFIELNTDGTKLGSGANAPTGTGFVWDTFIVRGSREERLLPTSHSALSGLNSLRVFKIIAAVSFRNAQPYTID